MTTKQGGETTVSERAELGRPAEGRGENQIKAEQLSASSFVFARNETQRCEALKTAALKQTAAPSQLIVRCALCLII